MGYLSAVLNFKARAAIQVFENDLLKPVVTSTQATLWNILRMAGVNERISGYGQLMSRF
jgi:maleate isomerase